MAVSNCRSEIIMFTSHNEIMQTARESEAYGRTEERQRLHCAATAIPKKRAADFPQLDITSAAMAATGWNECRETLLKAIGVKA